MSLRIALRFGCEVDCFMMDSQVINGCSDLFGEVLGEKGKVIQYDVLKIQN